MTVQLKKNSGLPNLDGPLVLVIADGVGAAEEGPSNAVTEADTPTLDSLQSSSLYRTLAAHGTAVGLPSDSDIGNSEVGHNAMGAGRIFDQGAKLVNNAIESESLFSTELWKEMIEDASQNCLHIIALHSDGRVHSDIAQIHAVLRAAAGSGVIKARLHILLDGRDTPERSALGYIEFTENFLTELTQVHKGAIDFAIASGGGRMKITMDRYEADWPMVERGYNCHTHGKGRGFRSATEAVETMYSESDLGDQNLDEFVIVDEAGNPTGTMSEGDVVVLMNFRGDRAIEISQAYEDPGFTQFDRGNHPDVNYMGLLQYDGDLHIPEKFLVAPPAIDRTLSEYLCSAGIRSSAISETQKFGHVTYFWNGNASGYVDESLEQYIEVDGINEDFEKTPEMKAKEITDVVVEQINSGDFDFIRLNYPNGDMVGHTGDLDATVKAMEAVDIQLQRLLDAVEAAGGALVYTADHGNADVMYTEKSGVREPVTSHTVSPVPFVIAGTDVESRYQLAVRPDGGLSHLAATLCVLLGFDPPADYQPSLIEAK